MKQIYTLQDLALAARRKQSVVVNHYVTRPSPAAWMINIIGARLSEYLDAGMFIYEPKPRLSKFSDRKAPTKQEIKLLTNNK